MDTNYEYQTFSCGTFGGAGFAGFEGVILSGGALRAYLTYD